jgi:hypothetical protein
MFNDYYESNREFVFTKMYIINRLIVQNIKLFVEIML